MLHHSMQQMRANAHPFDFVELDCRMQMKSAAGKGRYVKRKARTAGKNNHIQRLVLQQVMMSINVQQHRNIAVYSSNIAYVTKTAVDTHTLNIRTSPARCHCINNHSRACSPSHNTTGLKPSKIKCCTTAQPQGVEIQAVDTPQHRLRSCAKQQLSVTLLGPGT